MLLALIQTIIFPSKIFKTLAKWHMGNSTASQPHCTKVVSDFEEIFSIGIALNSKHFDKKNFKKLMFSRR
jgi:hypothetical protein